jgi:hypothetical protein
VRSREDTGSGEETRHAKSPESRFRFHQNRKDFGVTPAMIAIAAMLLLVGFSWQAV